MVDQQGRLSFENMGKKFMRFLCGRLFPGNQGRILLGPFGIIHADASLFQHPLQQRDDRMPGPAGFRLKDCGDLRHGPGRMIPQDLHDLPFSFCNLYSHTLTPPEI